MRVDFFHKMNFLGQIMERYISQNAVNKYCIIV